MTNYFVSLNNNGVLEISNNIEIPGGNITSNHGTINFNDEHLTTTGNITGNTITTGNITSSSSDISFSDKNLTTTGNITGNSITIDSNGTITSSGSNISFSNKNLTTTGYISSGLNTNSISYFGYAAIGYASAHNQHAAFAHANCSTNQGDYALQQTSGGQTTLNCKSGQNILFKLGNTIKMIMQNNANFGIGTTSPSGLIHIKDSGGTGPHALRIEGNPNSDTAQIYATGGGFGMKIQTNNNNGGKYVLQAINNSNVGLIVLNNGNVGIGTNSPQTKLEIGGYDPILLFKGTWASGRSYKIVGYADDKKLEFSYDHGTILADNNAVIFRVGSSHVERMRIEDNGRVGIGTASPGFPLHVSGQGPVTSGSGIYYRYISNYNNMQFGGPTSAHYVSAKFEGRIWITDVIYNSSDNRIKTNIEDVPDNLALQQLRSIPCRYYKYIDKLERGTDQTIGFIAQEVKSILPMAVSQQKQIIPNVYKIINSTWTSNDNTFFMTSSDLLNVNGIRYKFYVSNLEDASDEKIVEVTGNSDNTFTFDEKYNIVFCYGNEVDDFNILDKNKLYTLNFSATQEIDKIQQQHKIEIETLKSENIELKEKLTELTNKIKNATTFEDLKNSL